MPRLSDECVLFVCQYKEMYCLAIFIDSDTANSVSNYIIDEFDRGDHKSGLRTSSWARESIILPRDAPLNSVLSKVWTIQMRALVRDSA